MERPAVTLENYDDVYAYYQQHQQNRRVARLAYSVLATRFRPRVRYAEGAREKLRELIYDDTRLLIAVNHVSQTDPYTVAAAAWNSALRPVIGRTRVLAKDELFADAKQRRRIEMMGGIPVFRGKNHGLRAVSEAGTRMMDVCADRVAGGDDIAIFPEGTCNEGDPRTLQHVGSGIGHIAKRARAKGIEPRLVLMGLNYGPPPGKYRGASVYLDVYEGELPDKPMAYARVVAERLQVAVDRAVRMY